MKEDDIAKKFTDQFFAATEGRNDIRRAQIRLAQLKAVHEALDGVRIVAEALKGTLPTNNPEYDRAIDDVLSNIKRQQAGLSNTIKTKGE